MNDQDVNGGFCGCGCGEKTKLAEKTRGRLGWVKGQPIPYIRGHGPRKSLVTPDRFEEDPNTHCWLWQGWRNADDPRRGVVAGYGCFMRTVDGKRRIFYAHRTLYEELIGPIPEGLTIDHLCRVHACCNPGHLEPVTHAENLHRGKGAKLSHELADFIRSSSLSNKELAQKLGVDDSQISRVRTGQRWVPTGRHLEV